jgi:2-dehydropantoate 2-reductase
MDGEKISVSVEAVTSLEDIRPTSRDILVIATKSQDTESVAHGLRRIFDGATPVMCLQNGVRNEEIAARRFAVIYAGLVFFSATQLSPSDILVPPGRKVAIGLYPDSLDDNSRRMSEDFSVAGFESMASAHVMAMKYGKLVANLNNATHAITGYWLELGAADEDMRALMLAVREEGLRVLEAAKIAVEPPSDEPSPIRILGMTEKLRKPAKPGARDEALNLPLEERTYASMWQDLHAGRKGHEAEFLNGEIVNLGKSLGIATPYNIALLEIVRGMFEKELKPGIYTPAELHRLIEMRSGHNLSATE